METHNPWYRFNTVEAVFEKFDGQRWVFAEEADAKPFFQKSRKAKLKNETKK